MSDSKGRSFVFSVTAKDAFYLKDKSRAIFRCKGNNRLTFGIDEFTICDNANKVRDCWMNVNFSYFNSKYHKSNPTKYDKE